MNNDIKRDKADTPKEFIGEIVNIENDIIEVKNGTGYIHSFRIIGLDVPKELKGFVSSKQLKMLEVGDKVKVNIEEGRLTSIQRVIKNGKDELQ